MIVVKPALQQGALLFADRNGHNHVVNLPVVPILVTSFEHVVWNPRFPEVGSEWCIACLQTSGDTSVWHKEKYRVLWHHIVW
jgi:hypothetical protein